MISKSEPNFILFVVEKFFLMKKLGMHTSIIEKNIELAISEHTENGEWYQTPMTRVDPISHDNLTAIHAYCLYKFGHSFIAPVFHRKAPHPRDVFYYLYCRYPNKLTELGLIVTGISCLIACMRKRNETSGKLLVWTRNCGINYRSRIFNWFYQLCIKELEKRHGKNYWDDVFRIYFGQTFPDIYILAKDYYNYSSFK
jgi:hypothetical protein